MAISSQLPGERFQSPQPTYIVFFIKWIKLINSNCYKYRHTCQGRQPVFHCPPCHSSTHSQHSRRLAMYQAACRESGAAAPIESACCVKPALERGKEKYEQTATNQTTLFFLSHWCSLSSSIHGIAEEVMQTVSHWAVSSLIIIVIYIYLHVYLHIYLLNSYSYL